MTDTFTPAHSPNKTITLLSVSQAIAGSQQALIMAVGALVGVTMAPDPKLATLPTTMMIIGLALSAGPAALTVNRLGRRRAFILGAGLSVVGGLIAASGIILLNFYIFILALAVGGGSAAFAQQYRFAAADSAPDNMKGKAISFVLAGGVIAGFLGPALSRWGRTLVPGHDYAGSFLAVSVLALVAMTILSRLRLPAAHQAKAQDPSRPLSEIVRSPKVFVPVVTGMISYGLMTFVMVAAPLAMVVMCEHSPESATTAIQWHIVSMYAPSFFTGTIIGRIGARPVTGIGLALILGAALIALNGIAVWNFDLALILLGVGWNFGFIGSTALLAQGYRREEAAKVQAFNEQLFFGTMAVASISSGVLLQTIGWQAINIMAIPIATIPIATIAIALLAWGDWRAGKPHPA